MRKGERRKIGEILLDAGFLREGQLREALEEAGRRGMRVGQLLLEKGWVTEEDLTEALSSQLKLEKVSFKTVPPDKKLAGVLPDGLVRRYHVVPYAMDGQILVVAMADPLNVFAGDALRQVTSFPIRKVLAPASHVKDWISAHYGLESTLQEAVSDLGAGGPVFTGLGAGEDSPDRLAKIAEETPVVRLVNALLRQAVVQRASDIHIDPQEKGMRVRLRVDGVLEEAVQIPLHLRLAVVSRLKILSGMDIAEKRMPQDGRFRWKEEGREVDVRASTLPTVHGEKVVLRLLDRSGALLGLSQLGLGDDLLRAFREIIRRPHGIVLVSGPTGSGKSTTLYGALAEINDVGRNIVTVEDPVEYELAGIIQVQVLPAIGLEFSTILRNMLRQDPDVIMVGEIRDADTARIAINAALTGHLVFSTLHTNDALGAIPRLLDMGIEPYLIKASLGGVMAQRLVRKLCPACRTPVSLSPEDQARLGGKGGGATFFRAAGCGECRQTGYRGRTGIFEMFRLDQALRDQIGPQFSLPRMTEILGRGSFVSLREEGIRKAAQGVTSLEEVFRVTQDVEM